MAIVPVHKQITKKVMSEFGFSEAMQEAAALANAAVDEKQNNVASETNLHAMRGYVDESHSRMQSAEETRRAVQALLDRAKEDILQAIREGNREHSVILIGAALHTIQDRAIHHFEAWPYGGIADAIARDPGYMIKHGVRDMCLIRYLAAGHTSVPLSGSLSVETGLRLPVSTPVSLGVRGTYQQHYDTGTPEWIGLLSLCIGDCHSGRQPTRRLHDPPLPLGSGNGTALPIPVWTYNLRVEPQELQTATSDSRAFLMELKQAAGDAAWRQLTTP